MPIFVYSSLLFRMKRANDLQDIVQDAAQVAMNPGKKGKQQKQEEREQKAIIKALRRAYKIAIKDQPSDDYQVLIDGMTLEQVKAILDATGQDNNGPSGGISLLDVRDQGTCGSMHASRGGSNLLGDLDMEDGGFSPSDVQDSDFFPSATQPLPEAENNSMSDEEESDSCASCHDDKSSADDGMNISHFSVYGNEEEKYTWLVQQCNTCHCDGSMFLTHSEDDESNSAIMCMPGWNEKRGNLNWKIMFQPGFLIPPSDQQGTPVYFCDCCPECIRAKLEVELLMGYTIATDNFNPHHQVPSCSCKHISALQGVVKNSGMTATEFAMSVRQTCKCLSNQIHWLAGQALSNL